jgi:hypothetical protein
MSLKDEINATYQKIVLDVMLNGTRQSNVFGVDASMGLSQINAQTAIILSSQPSVREGQSAEVWAGYNGRAVQIFKGEITGFNWEYAPGKVTVEARDLLSRTRMPWGSAERTYTSQDDAAVIRNLLEAMGIPSWVAKIVSSSWTLGVAQDVVARKNAPFWQLISEIDKLAGYRTFTRSDGTIFRERVSGIAGGGAAWAFDQGTNILRVRRHRTVDGIANRVTIEGLNYEGVEVTAEANGTNPFVPNPPGYIGINLRSDLIETTPRAEIIAARELSDKNRRPEGVEVETFGNPLLQPQMTVCVNANDIGGNGYFMIDGVRHSIRAASFRTTFTTLGGSLSGSVPPANYPALVAFDVKMFQEGEDTGAGVTSQLVVICDASNTVDPDGDIDALTYAWTVTTVSGTVSPSSGTASIFRCVVTGTTSSITVTLAVTDAGGDVATLAKEVPIGRATLLIEDIYVAYDGAVACSSDGEQNWRTATPASGNATCLMPFAPEWGEIWGTSTGHIYATFDKLLTVLIDLGQPHGAVACTAVWVHESDTTRLWAGFSDGRVYYGELDVTAQTATWTHQGTITGGPSIVEIRESYGALGELRATAGTGYYYSTNSGTTWSLQHTFDVAWRMAAGFDTNLASGLNDVAPIYDEDTTPPTVPGGVTHIRGLSFGWREQELYGADNTAALYLGAGPTFNLSLHADSTAAITNHMVRSGNVDRVVYMAIGDGTGVNNGFQKWLPGVKAPFYIRKTSADQGYMIGYGPAHPPEAQAEVVLLPYEASGAADNIFLHTPDAGWSSITPPNSGWAWFKVYRNMFNTDQWLLVGNIAGFTDGGDQYVVSGGAVKVHDGSSSPLFYSSDNGASWNQVTLNTSKTRCDSRLNVAWSDTDSSTFFVAMTIDTPFNNEQLVFWRGTAGVLSASENLLSAGTARQDTWSMVSGTDGQAVISATIGDETPRVVKYVARAGSTLIGSTTDGPTFYLEHVLSDSLGMVAISGTDVYATVDYQSIDLTLREAAAGTTIAAAGDTVFIGGRSVSGILGIADIFDTPVSTVVPITAGMTVGAIRAARRLHQSVACRKDPGVSKDLFVFNGLSWSVLPGPSDADVTKLMDFIEVVE